MALEFKEYDMRRFNIKDQKDVYAFLDVLDKAIPQIRSLTKKLVMENAAKASVINNLTRKQAENIPRLNLGTDEEDGIIQMANPSLSTFEQEREAILERMRESRDVVNVVSKQLETPPSNDEKDEPVKDGNSLTVMSGDRKTIPDELQPVSDEKTSYTPLQSVTEGVEEDTLSEKDESLRIIASDYTRQVTSRGLIQWRYRGILCKASEVPEDVKVLLTPQGE